jgi:hypothetical protein
VQSLLSVLGYKLLPDGTIYSRTLALMSKTGLVQVELKDGRRVLGYPRIGPQHQEDGINELYLVQPETLGPDGGWEPMPGVVASSCLSARSATSRSTRTPLGPSIRCPGSRPQTGSAARHRRPRGAGRVSRPSDGLVSASSRAAGMSSACALLGAANAPAGKVPEHTTVRRSTESSARCSLADLRLPSTA